MFLFTGAPTRECLPHPSNPPPVPHRNLLSERALHALVLPPLSDGSSSLGYSNVVRGRFYKTAFLQRHTSFVTAVRSPSALALLPVYSFATHILWSRPRKGASRGVPLHPLRVVDLEHAGPIYWLTCTYITPGRHALVEVSTIPQLEASGDFYGSILCACSLRNCHARSRSER